MSLSDPAPAPTVEDRRARPLRPTPDRSAHPSVLGPPWAERIRPTGSISFGALRAVAAGLARTQEPAPIGGAGDSPRSWRLAATAFYDAWLITWPAGSGLGPHDHGDVRSVLPVIDGELTEIFSDRVECQDPTVRVLSSGSSTSAEPSEVHALINRSGADATSLHVYSPPLADVSSIDLVTHRAGREEMVPPRPSPLTLVR